MAVFMSIIEHPLSVATCLIIGIISAVMTESRILNAPENAGAGRATQIFG